MNKSEQATDPFDGITLVTKPSKGFLGPRQLRDYRAHREACIDWLLHFGKDPDEATGYAVKTVENRAARMDMFYRFVWDGEGRYTTRLTHEHAHEWMKHHVRRDTSNADKSSHRKATMMLYKWLHHERGLDPWEPEFSFSRPNQTTTPRDYLTRVERSKIEEAALQYGSVPSYGGLTPDERDRWRAYLAQRFGKEKSEITQRDWIRANGWKIPSLVWVSLDAGLRPIEVERARVSWVDLPNGILRIPREQSSKNHADWQVSLRQRTVEILGDWLREREVHDLYNETDALWLTKEGNPYRSATLRYVLHRLCDEAGIDTANRKMSWYAIRHSLGTYLTREEGLAAAQTQMRHLDPKSTMKYDQTPTEDRRAALERI